MNKEEKYKVILIMCFIFFITLLIKNYFLINKRIECNTKLTNLEQVEKNKQVTYKRIKCSDVIKLLQDQQDARVIEIDNKKDDKASIVKVESNWDVEKTKNMLKKIQNRNGFIDVSNLLIEKDAENKIVTEINMKFAK
ncbi:hypothetical protein Ccar_25545 [Clostridium carboxidivorans P7]|uniref:Uncharacterized protein n=1 Tax=Clostridium carboxidivorans P7 TaxID=536227 RepID=C6PQT1_9CLOT|nr:hypothetical protein [Clostridium carboxidivorans]AKN34015.1 hypothetical protein Ccar_25545 [Clostridium carboxidivorans P7]EET88453.1 hypothetical protein CcarbDRAFT_1148 [Clostridium carboxidivorans P7]EFG88112.1 hypothetical protein CLCAR_2100 [Clostridium carboxidivorans P7]